MDCDFVVHRVETKSGAVVDQEAARFIFGNGPKGISRELFPVNEIGGRRESRCPEVRLVRLAGFLSPVVDGKVLIAVANDLIHRDQVLIVLFGARNEDRFVLNVHKDFGVDRSSEPDPRVFTLVEQTPLTVFVPGGGSSKGTVGNRFAAGESHVETTDAVPLDSIARCQKLCAVLGTFREHVVDPFVGNDTYVFHPMLGIDGVLRISIPDETIARRRIAQHFLSGACPIVTRVPELPLFLFANDPSPFTNFYVPVPDAGCGEDWVMIVGNKSRQFGREFLVGAAGVRRQNRKRHDQVRHDRDKSQI